MSTSRTRIWRATVAIVVFVIAYELHALLGYLGFYRVLVPLAVSGVVNVLQVALCVLGVALVYGAGLKAALGELGLCAPIGRALVFSFVAALPMLIGFALTSNVASRLSIWSMLVITVVSPFAEEVLFRGYIFRQLYRRAKLGFWTAVLVPSMLFALGHVYQARSTGELIGITAVTGIGSIIASWLFMKWHDNLWIPFGLHALMNFWWDLFAVDETALGGWLANVVRILTILLAVALTIYKDRIWKPLPRVSELTETDEKPDGSATLMLHGASPALHG